MEQQKVGPPEHKEVKKLGTIKVVRGYEENIIGPSPSNSSQYHSRKISASIGYEIDAESNREEFLSTSELAFNQAKAIVKRDISLILENDFQGFKNKQQGSNQNG